MVSPPEASDPEKHSRPQSTSTNSAGEGRKRPWSWARKGGEKGYSPVGRHDMSEGNALPAGYVGYAEERKDKRRSWFGRGGSEQLSQGERVKRDERDRERERFEREGMTYGPMYAS